MNVNYDSSIIMTRKCLEYDAIVVNSDRRAFIRHATGHSLGMIKLVNFIQTKRSERAKRAHSVLREVEKMGYKKIFTRTRIG